MSASGSQIGRVGAFRARMAGSLARKNGQPVTAVPYDLLGDWNDRVKGRFWIRGWERADRVLRESEQQATQEP